MFTIKGIDLRITEGKKFPGDLVLEQWNGLSWVAIPFDVTFLQVDFFSENERLRAEYEDGWVQNGDRYFWSQCMDAVRHGWRHAADKLARQRRRRGTAA